MGAGAEGSGCRNLSSRSGDPGRDRSHAESAVGHRSLRAPVSRVLPRRRGADHDAAGELQRDQNARSDRRRNRGSSDPRSVANRAQDRPALRHGPRGPLAGFVHVQSRCARRTRARNGCLQSESRLGTEVLFVRRHGRPRDQSPERHRQYRDRPGSRAFRAKHRGIQPALSVRAGGHAAFHLVGRRAGQDLRLQLVEPAEGHDAARSLALERRRLERRAGSRLRIGSTA